MMTTMLRILLVLVSVVTMAYMLRKIRQAKMQIEAAMFWIAFALALVAFSVYPPMADACARLLGIYSTPNFLFLSMIFLLVVKVFGMTLHISQLESRQKDLAQKIALDQKDMEELEQKVQSLLEERDRAFEVENEDN